MKYDLAAVLTALIWSATHVQCAELRQLGKANDDSLLAPSLTPSLVLAQLDAEADASEYVPLYKV